MFIEEEDWEALKNSIQNYNNFDPLALGKTLRSLSSLPPRRIAAKLFSGLGKFEESLTLSKEDKSYQDAIQTANASGDPELVENLLRFFIEKKLYEEFTASLYSCYDLVKPDVALELAWKSNITNVVMPYFCQVMREFSTKLANIPSNTGSKKGGLSATATGGFGTPGMIPTRLTGEAGDPNAGGGPPMVFAPGVDPNLMYNPYGPMSAPLPGVPIVGGPVGVYGPGAHGGGPVFIPAGMNVGQNVGTPVMGGNMGGTPPVFVSRDGRRV